jgi:hypothetical protein
MSLSTSKAALHDAMKKLRVRTDSVKELWDDESRRRFERDYIDPLEALVISTVKGMEAMESLIAQVRRECGDD